MNAMKPGTDLGTSCRLARGAETSTTTSPVAVAFAEMPSSRVVGLSRVLGLSFACCLLLIAPGQRSAHAGELSAKTTAVVEAIPTDADYSFTEALSESIWGDVYAEPSKWQELSHGDFFTKGWDKPWASPPTGGGGAPRQGWLNAFEGVFYRLGIAVFGWQHDLLNNGDGYTGNLENFTPINQRFEIQTDIGMTSNRGVNDTDPNTNFSDFRITPRFMLSETRDVTQTFQVMFRTPTGNPGNPGNGVAAIHPQYQFWANWWQGLVVRGGVGFSVPYAGEINKSGWRSTFDADLAIGYYFTPHEMTPVGDMVWYVATNFNQAIDDRSPSSRTFLSLSPGFRTHVGDDWYLLGAVEVPVTRPEPYDYQVMGGIMKVY